MKPNFLKHKFFILWLPVILYAGLIFYLSSREQIQLPVSFPFMDKLLHICEYTILGLLLARAIKRTYHFRDVKKVVALIMVIAFVYGLSDEFHQYFVPGRTLSFWDAVSDGIGGFLGAIIYR